MKLSSAAWIVRYRLVQPVLNFLLHFSQRFLWLCLYPLYKGIHSVGWILRWRVIGGLANFLVSTRLFVRWRIVYPFVKKIYSARWIIRWRVIKPLFDQLQYAVWFLRWRLIYPAVKLILPSTILRILYPARARGVIRFLKDLRIPSIALASFSQYASQTNALTMQLGATEHVVAPPALMYPARTGASLGTADQDYDFPPICVHTMRQASVMGRSNLVFADGALYHHDLYRFTHDFTSEELHGKIRVLPAKSLVKPYEMAKKKQVFDQAVVFMDSCSSNYAHWLTEVLPRVNAYWNGLGGDDRDFLARRIGDDGQPIPLLLDAGLHLNINDSLLAIVGAKARVVRVANSAHVDVRRLLVTSPTGYVPFDRRSFSLKGHSEGVFSPQALKRLREHLAMTLPPATQATPKKIFLKRNTKARAMLNAEVIEQRLVQEGFVVVSTELMTFAEQFRIFSGADVVVGATGAAFANLIFCKPNAKIVICIARFEDTSYGYWQNLACAAGNSVTYVLGRMAGTLVKSIHSDFSIDMTDLTDALAQRPSK